MPTYNQTDSVKASSRRTHPRPITPSRRCLCAPCRFRCRSTSPEGFPTGACPLFWERTSKRTWSHKLPCSPSQDPPFAAQSEMGRLLLNWTKKLKTADLQTVQAVRRTRSKPRRATLRTITVVSKPMPVRKPAHSRATSGLSQVEDSSGLFDSVLFF